MISEEILKETTARLVALFHPEKIILFGSQARGTATKDSDVDLLVICDVPKKRHELVVDMYRALGGIHIPAEIHVLTPKEYELDRQITGTIARPASREGRVLSSQSGLHVHAYSMKEVHARKLQIVRRWIKIAESDFRVARTLLEAKDFSSHTHVAFYAEQCVEKYLKAWLCLHDVEIRKTHDIHKLRLLFEEQTGSTLVELSNAETLTPFWAAYEYPEQDIEVTVGDAKNAIKLASHVSKVMRPLLKQALADQREI